jgi:intracellular septation protein A
LNKSTSIKNNLILIYLKIIIMSDNKDIQQAQIGGSNDNLTSDPVPQKAPTQGNWLDKRVEPATAKKIRIFGFIFQNVIMEIALPLILFFTLKGPLGEIKATIISSVPSLLSALWTILVKRRFEPLPYIMIASFFIGLGLTLAYQNPNLKQIDGSVITGCIGLAYLVSLGLKRPLIYYFSRPWVTKNVPEAIKEYDAKWENPGFRKAMTVISIVWGVGFLIQAAINLALVFTINIDLLMILSPVLTYGNIGLLVIWTTIYSLRKKKQAEERIKRQQQEQGQGQQADDQV